MSCYAFRRWGQESDADDFSEEIFFKAFRKLKGGQRYAAPPFRLREKTFASLTDSLLAESNPHVSRLPELLSDFYQPSVADFALIDASRIDVNFCVGPFECVRKLAGYLIPTLFFDHGDRY